MEINLKFKIILFALIFCAQMVHAGAILQIDRVDLTNGQKIIFFSELHIGQITEYLDSKYVCNRQRRPFYSLFNRMIPFKTNISFYIEFNEGIVNYNRARHQITGTFPLAGCEPSFFDQYYLNYMFGRTQWESVDVVRNFDARTKQDWNLLNSAVMFGEFFRRYKASGFDKAKFDELKNDFFNKPNLFTPFTDPNNTYILDFTQRMAQLMIRVQSKVPADDYPRVALIGSSRLANLQAFILLNEHLRSFNKPLFDFLFDMAEQHKDNFYPQLSALLTNLTHGTIQITSMFDLVYFVSVIADLSLLEALITDSHAVILVSCGARHSQMVIQNFFMNNPRVRAIRTLKMTEQNIIGDLDFAEATVINFVEQP